MALTLASAGLPACAGVAGRRRAVRSSGSSAARSVSRPARVGPLRAVIDEASSEGIPFSSDSVHLDDWHPSSWRDFEVLQQPEYPDDAEVRAAFKTISNMPPLVFAGECRTLQERIASASAGEAFCLFGGDCAESFSDFSANHIR